MYRMLLTISFADPKAEIKDCLHFYVNDETIVFCSYTDHDYLSKTSDLPWLLRSACFCFSNSILNTSGLVTAYVSKDSLVVVVTFCGP